MLAQWWETLSTFQQILFVLAGTAFGGDVDVPDADVDVDADVDEINDEPVSAFSGLRIVTVRGVLAFLSVGAWTAYALSDVAPVWLAILVGVVAGALASFLLALAFRASMKLESVGNLDYKNAVGKAATVYIKVPHARTGKGKITVMLQERYVEADAVTDDAADLVTGTAVDVVGLTEETTFVVRRKP
jgi:hypothetical protein